MVAAALFPTFLGRRPNHREMRVNVGGRNSAWHYLGVAACRVHRKKRAFLPLRYRDRGGRSRCTTLELGLMCLFIAESGRTVESPKADCQRHYRPHCRRRALSLIAAKRSSPTTSAETGVRV